MKKNQPTTPPAPDWTRAKSLLSELEISVRRSLSAQVLLGKELATIKKRLGFIHGRNRWTPQVADSRNWGEWCKSELDISVDTADRWIQCFDVALKRAKVRKRKEPQAAKLLEIPADELTGEELEELAQVVQGLVAGDTQAGLLEELRIVKRINRLTGGDTSQSRNDDQAVFDQVMIEMFSEITRGFDQLERKIFRGRNRAEFQAMLEFIPLASEDRNAPCLYAIRDSLRAVLDGELRKMTEAVEQTIKEKENPGTPAKPRRLKHTNT
ncbi:MAG: hypothetical protein ABJQ29_11360 [Luteolibacter sp.]